MKPFLYIFSLSLLASCVHKPVINGTRIGDTALTVETPENVILKETQPVGDFYLLYFMKGGETFLSMYVGNTPDLQNEELYNFAHSTNYLQHFCKEGIEAIDCYIKMAFDFPKYIKYKSVSAEYFTLTNSIVRSIKVNETWLKNGKE